MSKDRIRIKSNINTKPNKEEFQDTNSLKIGDPVMVHAYKYNGWLYRTWSNPIVVHNSDDLLILCSTKSQVITSEENTFRNFNSYTKRTSYWFFNKDDWFNTIISIDNDGIKTYINVASPFIYEQRAIKYYDFDLDFKIGADGSWREVDIDEFFDNTVKYQYPPALIHKIVVEEQNIIKKIKNNHFKNLISKEALLKLHCETSNNISNALNNVKKPKNKHHYKKRRNYYKKKNNIKQNEQKTPNRKRKETH
ncbi:DUF402 domain-containing protein [Ureaplasma diversum]|uniref:DUF402 domain-containing protein n=1 Tax=Ureaplasma diversum TaxID=42094 RepID=UPI000B0E67DF|nr:DUF402 domain-containing protein [Ureaplasma diversum]